MTKQELNIGVSPAGERSLTKQMCELLNDFEIPD
jgi:hypothetical protein